MNYDTIGKFIQEKRKAKGLTQKDLANKIGVTDKAVSKWETGLGCPDVSILEILSKELDCSILELLKGREIIDEVIPVTEMDDYIKEGIKYSKNSFKLFINKLIAFIVIFIVLILLILNIININNQRKLYAYDFRITKDTIDSRINEINKNIKIIKKNKGKYSSDDYKIIIDTLDDITNSINNNLLYKYDDNMEFTIKDLYVIDALSDNYGNMYNLLYVAKKYDKNIENYYQELVESYGTRIFLGSSLMARPYSLSYQYILDDNNEVDDTSRLSVNARVYDNNYVLKTYIDVTNLIIEVGDIHE